MQQSQSTTVNPKQFLDGILPAESVRQGAVIAKQKKPRYSKGTTAPYYNEAFGKGLLPVLIEMLKSQKDKEFVRQPDVKIATLYQRVQQSFAYCVDHLDESAMLEKLRNEIRIVKTPRGVVLCFVKNYDKYAHPANMYTAMPRTEAFVVRDATTVDWRQKLQEFIETSDQAELCLTDGFILSGEEVAQIKMTVDLMPIDMPIEVVKLHGFAIHLRREVVA